MSTDRPWQNWDAGDVAQRIDKYWVEGGLDLNRQQALEIKALCGGDVPIFEVGCGTGLMAQALFEAGVTRPEKYVGGDVSKKMLAIARERLPAARFEELDIYNLSDAQHDNVVCLHVLQHLPHYIGPLGQLLKVMTRTLYIATWISDTAEDQIRFVDEAESRWGVSFYANVYSLPRMVAHIERLSGRKPAIRHLVGPIYSVTVAA